MRTLTFVAACGLLVLTAGGALAEEKAATAAGSGQNQAAPSSEANPPTVLEPTTAGTAAGQGQNQAAPSGDAKSVTTVAPAAGEPCPAGQALQAGGGCGPAR